MHARSEPDAPRASVDGVRLLRWPDEDCTRLELATQSLPRLLLVAEGAPPPEHWDDLEDWARLPLDADELRARTRTLGRRARAAQRPRLDSNALLWAGDRWIDLPVAPRAVAALMVERFTELVTTMEIEKVYLDHGGSIRTSARKAMIVRLRGRLSELGLVLHSVRDAGYVLDWDEAALGCATPPSPRCAAPCSRCSGRRGADETSA